jgi:histidinol phosphatase-like PHP family hydrolase
MVRAAQEAGLEAIGITDHIIFPKDRVRPGLVRARLPREMDGLRVYVGCEADMQSASRCSIDAEFAAGLDYVVMAASHLYVGGVELPPQLDPRGMASFIVELMNAAIANGLADIIAHPFGVPECPYAWEELIAAADPDAISRTAETAARAGVAMELNPRYLRQAPEAARWLFRRVLEAGCKLALSSDAHHPSNVGCRGTRYATEEEMRAEGITEDRLWSVEDRVSPRR